MKNHYLALSPAEVQIIDSYKTVLVGLGNYLGRGYELILHSLASLDHSVIAIVNGFHSGRKIGSPITNFALSMLQEIQESKDHSAISYLNKSASGVLLKSTTIPVTGDHDRIIGLICINFYTDTPLSSILDPLLISSDSSSTSTFNSKETFSEDIDDLIRSTLDDVKTSVEQNPSISTQNRNKEIIIMLYQKGIFQIKDSVVKVAQLMNISQNTVYMHIRNSKNKEGSYIS